MDVRRVDTRNRYAPTEVLDLRILGQMDATLSGKPLELGPPKQRLLLAVLLIAKGHPVSTAKIIDSLWGTHPPASAKQNIHLHIHRIRRAIGSHRVVTCGNLGYKLVIDREELDAHRFADSITASREAISNGEKIKAARLIRNALAEWRGHPFAEFIDCPTLQQQAAQLEEMRLQALEYQIDIELTLGDYAHLINVLRPLLTNYPYREKFHEQLIITLHQLGRPAEALQAYQEARKRIAEDLGLEVGAPLRSLELKILNRHPQPSSSPFFSERLQAGAVSTTICNIDRPHEGAPDPHGKATTTRSG